MYIGYNNGGQVTAWDCMSSNLRMVATALTLMLSALSAQAAEPLALQGVMKDLGKHMQTIATAIAYEDWERVEATAPLIAEHPQPPFLEKARIISFVGGNMSRFKALDAQTKDAALEMQQAAREKNGVQVIAAFGKVQLSCLDCHQTFRKSFVEHFYGRK